MRGPCIHKRPSKVMEGMTNVELALKQVRMKQLGYWANVGTGPVLLGSLDKLYKVV